MIEQCKELLHLNWGVEEKFVIPTKYTATILHSLRQLVQMIESVFSPEEMEKIFQHILDDITENFLRIFEETNMENELASKR